jgi:hypothetical protein
MLAMTNTEENMKSEIYNALAGLNRGLDVAVESLTVLLGQGVLTAEYVERHTVMVEELRAGLNHMTVEKLHSREEEDWEQFGRMRITIEEGLRNGTTTTTTPGSGTDASRTNE